MSQALRKTAGHASIYALGVLLNRAVSFVMLPVHTRYLTTADYGVLELLEMTIDIVSIFASLGVISGLYKYYYEYDTERDRCELVSTLFLVVLGCYALACSLGVLGSSSVARLLFGAMDSTRLVQFSFVNLLLSCLIFVPLGYLQAKQLPMFFVAVSCAKLILQLSLNIVFVVYLRMGVVGVLYSTMITSAIIGGGLTIYIFSRVGFHFVKEKAGILLRFGYPFVLTGVGAFVATFSDRYFLNYYYDAAAVGLYSFAYKFGFLLIVFPVSPVFNIWMVQRFELVKQPGYVAIFNRFFLWFVVLAAGGCLGIAVFVRDLLRIMSAPGYHPAWRIVPLILVAYFMQACTQYFNFGILHSARTKHLAVGTGLAALTIVGLSFLWIPAWGMSGAASATLVSFALRLVYVYAASQRCFPIAHRLWRPFAVALLASTLFAVWRGTIAHLELLDRITYSISFSVGICLLFPVLLIAFRILPSNDRALLVEWVTSPRESLSRFRQYTP